MRRTGAIAEEAAFGGGIPGQVLRMQHDAAAWVVAGGASGPWG
jgi:hypothetical protein